MSKRAKTRPSKREMATGVKTAPAQLTIQEKTTSSPGVAPVTKTTITRLTKANT